MDEYDSDHRISTYKSRKQTAEKIESETNLTSANDENSHKPDKNKKIV